MADTVDRPCDLLAFSLEAPTVIQVAGYQLRRMWNLPSDADIMDYADPRNVREVSGDCYEIWRDGVPK